MVLIDMSGEGGTICTAHIHHNGIVYLIDWYSNMAGYIELYTTRPRTGRVYRESRPPCDITEEWLIEFFKRYLIKEL